MDTAASITDVAVPGCRRIRENNATGIARQTGSQRRGITELEVAGVEKRDMVDAACIQEIYSARILNARIDAAGGGYTGPGKGERTAGADAGEVGRVENPCTHALSVADQGEPVGRGAVERRRAGGRPGTIGSPVVRVRVVLARATRPRRVRRQRTRWARRHQDRRSDQRGRREECHAQPTPGSMLLLRRIVAVGGLPPFRGFTEFHNCPRGISDLARFHPKAAMRP